MKKRVLFLFIIVISMIACQISPQNNTATQSEITGTEKPGSKSTSTPQIPSPAPTSTQETIDKMDFDYFYMQEYGEVSLKTYQPVPYKANLDSLPVNISNIDNPEVIEGLTNQQVLFLSQNGFVVIDAGDEQFKDLRVTLALKTGQPYYVTTDAAYHALHVTFDGLLASFEEEYLRPVLSAILTTEYDQIEQYMQQTKGTNIEEDVQLSLDYLAVAIKLLYPQQELDPDVEVRIAPQIEQIMAYGGQAPSVLIPTFVDDYGSYRPVSHYAGKTELENYFRSMTWLGRISFKFKDPEQPNLVPSRAPLIMTLALHEANFARDPLYQLWLDMHETIDFMIGPSDDPGPIELYALMQEVYSETISLEDLQNEQQWQIFLDQVDNLPAPQLNSTFAAYMSNMEASRTWRFMGQVFTLDGFIFQNLVFDKVSTMDNRRVFPTGLDIAAAFGSTNAYNLLEEAGETEYENYVSQMEMLQNTVKNQPEEQWVNRFYSTWLYAFKAQVQAKESYYPPLMNTESWERKEIISLLGSWAELKHDTVLYAKMPGAAGGGGPPVSEDAPTYVETNPDVFYRLAYAASSLHKGLYGKARKWDMMGLSQTPFNSYTSSIDFNSYYRHLGQLANTLVTLGDIAVKELNGEPLTIEDYSSAQRCLGPKECRDNGGYTPDPPDPDPIPIIAAVASGDSSVLEVGVGQLNRIYVAVPLEGKLQIAQGGVFTYYEFTQPMESRLTDEVWREMLENNQVSSPQWATTYVLPGGTKNDVLAFHVGDVFIVNEAGGNPPINLRAEPSTSSAIIKKLETGYYLSIIDGPVVNSEGTWWKIKDGFSFSSDENKSGWIFENPDWFKRSYIGPE